MGARRPANLLFISSATRCHLTLSQFFWDRIQPETFWLAGRKLWPATVFLIRDYPIFLHCQRNYVWLGWHHATYFVDTSQRSLDTWKFCFTVIISSHDFGNSSLWALITQAGFFMDALRVNIFCCFFDNLLMRKDIVGESSSSVKLTHILYGRSGTFQSSGFIYFFKCGKTTSLCSNLKSSIDAVTGSGCRHVNVCKGAHHCFPSIRASNHRRASYVLWHHSAELSEREFLIS